MAIALGIPRHAFTESILAMGIQWASPHALTPVVVIVVVIIIVMMMPMAIKVQELMIQHVPVVDTQCGMRSHPSTNIASIESSAGPNTHMFLGEAGPGILTPATGIAGTKACAIAWAPIAVVWYGGANPILGVEVAAIAVLGS